MGQLTPVDIFQEGALRVWSDENDLAGVWFDGHDWSKWWPTFSEIRAPSTHMPLVLLSLEESDLLWFKLDQMSPNLWQSYSASLKRNEYRTSYIRNGHPLESPDQRTIVGTKHICTMTKQIGSHALRVEGSLAYTGVGAIWFGSMSQVFVDDALAGGAIMTAVKGGVPGTGGIQQGRPAYVSIGGLLLAVFAPHFKKPGKPGWFLVPPEVEIWLRTTKRKLAGVPVTHHRYDSFAPNQVDRHVQVRGWIEEMNWLQHEHVVAKPHQLDGDAGSESDE